MPVEDAAAKFPSIAESLQPLPFMVRHGMVPVHIALAGHEAAQRYRQEPYADCRNNGLAKHKAGIATAAGMMCMLRYF